MITLEWSQKGFAIDCSKESELWKRKLKALTLRGRKRAEWVREMKSS